MNGRGGRSRKRPALNIYNNGIDESSCFYNNTSSDFQLSVLIGHFAMPYDK